MIYSLLTSDLPKKKRFVLVKKKSKKEILKS